MLNICFPRTKPLQASRGRNKCCPSEHPLSIPSPEPQPGPSLPLQPGTGLFSGAEHSRRLWQAHLPVLSPGSAGGAGIASWPAGCPRQHPAGQRAGTGCPAELGAPSTDPPGMRRGAAVPQSQPQSQLCPVAFQQPPTCLNPVAALKAQGGAEICPLLQGNPAWGIRCVQGHRSGHRGRSIPARAWQRGCAGMTSRDLGSDAGAHTEQTGVFAREEIYPGNYPIEPQ